MAQSLHMHHHQHHSTALSRLRHPLDTTSTPSHFLKPTHYQNTAFSRQTNPVAKLSHPVAKLSDSVANTLSRHNRDGIFTTTALPLSSTTSTPFETDPTTTPFSTLQHHLSTGNFRLADEETRRLLIHLTGDAAKKRGYVFFSEVQFIPKNDLITIDSLWRDHSNNKFGYSVQKKIWDKSNRDFSRFFRVVGWMKRLEGSEIEQYNYRAFPDEFIWELNEETPVGHLPLTNALRGTQLLSSIFLHPAFDDGANDDGEKETDSGDDDDNGEVKKRDSVGLGSKILFKPNYSF